MELNRSNRKIWLLTAFLLLLWPAVARAQGVILPEPILEVPDPSSLRLEKVQVDVNISDGVANTHVTQVFRNAYDRQMEGTFVFPLPKEAVVSAFSVWTDGAKVRVTLGAINGACLASLTFATSSAMGAIARINPKDGAEMVYVDAGEFLMGSSDDDKGVSSDQKPQHKVYLDGYWMYRTEVTVAQYRNFCQVTGRQMPPEPWWKWQEDHPIVNVNWDDAVAYAKWAGAALPTEAQWEKAARGTDGRQYPWGNDWDGAKCVNSVGGSSPGGTKPVGSCPEGASPYGALDMAGNVWDWCADWYDARYYQSSPAPNPAGPATGHSRVLRGVSWGFNSPGSFRSATRGSGDPSSRSGDYGFRCVLCSPGQ